MYKLILCSIVIVNFISCSSSDIKKFTDKTKTQTQKEIEKYKGNDEPHIIDDNENSSIPNDDIKEALNLQNEARHEVGISSEYDLKWSDKIAQDAKAYANELALSGAFEHDLPKNHLPSNQGGYANGPYGENLYAYYSSSGKKPTFTDASKSWIAEKKYYNGGIISSDSSECSGGQCEHYTQIVWRDTTRVGCARSKYLQGKFKDGYVIVCKYKTPGNIIGRLPY